MFPFKETFLKETKEYIEVIRLFDKDTDNIELNWHRDKENRVVTVIEGKEWQIQFENELPQTLQEGESFLIHKNKWHRIINKNRSNLKILIRKEKDQNEK